MDDYRDQHIKMLSRFIAALAKGGDDCWFDEDELVQIFDYAGDTGNDYVRAEVLMWGARYFPDSKILKERKCIFYNDVLDNEAVIMFHMHNRDKTTLITDLLYHRADNISSDEAEKYLNCILNQVTSLSDEETIQVVNFAFDTLNQRWLYDHLDDLRKLTEFTPSLLFEIAALSFEDGEYFKAIPLLEELVGETPYSVDYWDMLAKAYYAVERIDEGHDALEMALAIDPTFLPALQIKAHALALDGDLEQVKQLHEEYPDDQEIAEAYVNCMLFVNSDNIDAKKDEIVETLTSIAEQFPQCTSITNQLLFLAPEKAKLALQNLWQDLRSYSSFTEASAHWKSMTDELAKSGNFDGAIAAIKFFFDDTNDREFTKSSYADSMAVSITLLYFATKRWDDMMICYHRFTFPAMRTNCMVTAAYAISLLKTRQYDEARQFALNFMSSEKDFIISEDLDWCGIGNLTVVGLGLLMTDILAVTEPATIHRLNPGKYDPLHFWS